MFVFSTAWKYPKTKGWEAALQRCSYKKRCSENMQQIYKKTRMLKCDFYEVALQLYWNLTSTWVISCKFPTFFQNTFS